MKSFGMLSKINFDVATRLINCISLAAIATILFCMCSKMPKSITMKDIRSDRSKIQEIPLTVIHHGDISIIGDVETSVSGHIDKW